MRLCCAPMDSISFVSVPHMGYQRGVAPLIRPVDSLFQRFEGRVKRVVGVILDNVIFNRAAGLPSRFNINIRHGFLPIGTSRK